MGGQCYCLHTNQTEMNNTTQAPHIQVQKTLPDNNIYLNFRLRLRSKIALTIKIDPQKKSVVLTTSLWDKLSFVCALFLPSKSLLLLCLNFCDSYLTNPWKTWKGYVSALWQNNQNSLSFWWTLSSDISYFHLMVWFLHVSFLRRGVTHDLLGQTEVEQKIRGQRKQLRGLPRTLAPVGGVVLHRQREHPAKTPPPADRYICHQGNRWHDFFLFDPA